MNKGEGARIAAKSKSGQVGIYLFKEPEKRKKKFNYKSRTQGFAVRKVATSGENEPIVPETKINQKETSTQKKKQTLNKPNDATKVAKSQQNFVKKNIQKTKKQVSTANTVTLTQDQLNKILQTLGSENASLKVENGDIKIEDATCKQDSEHEKAAELDNDGIVNSTEKLSLNQEPLQVPNEKETEVIDNKDAHTYQSNVEEITEAKELNEKNVSATTPRSNLGDIGSSIGITGFNDKDDAQRRRQQWKAELDKQVAEKQKEKERMKKARLSGDGAADWSPWGNLGDSGGRGQKKVESLPPQPTQAQNLINEKSNNQPFKPDPPISRMDHSYRQGNTPAAMRSSFSFGNYTDESLTLKQKEKKAWLEELEKQRQEVKARQAKEKLEASKTEEDYWAKQVPAVRNSMTSQNMVNVTSQNMVTKDDTAMQEKASDIVRSETVQSDPMSGTTATVTNTIITPRGHQRGQWSLTDPAEVERQEKARAKHLEHIEAVKAQVEEKQRLKREAMERKKREDKEEEEKLARERENLQKQVEMENQRQKQKEQDELARHQALVESMQRAYEESVKIKQEKRRSRLNTHTSDVLNDVQHKENENIAATPRIGGSHGPVQRTPPPAPVQIEPQISKSVDVGQSTVFEQGVQTDPTPVHEEELLTRLIERDKSAGIEYKEHKEERQKKLKENDNYNLLKEEIEIPKSRENKEIEVKVKKRKNKISERPKWGVKSESKKKVKASDKDLTVSKKVREERRQKRIQELLADQERNMPRPRSKKEGGKTKNRGETPAFRVIPCSENEIDEVLKYSRQDQRSQRNQRGHRGQQGQKGQQDQRDHYDERHQQNQRGHKEQEHHTSQESRTDHYREDERLSQARQKNQPSHHFEDAANTPPLKTGDFVPFLRTDERLDVDSVPVSPIEYYGQNIWERNVEPESNRKHTHHQQSHKDPLFSPDIRKDGENRQRMILKQLSNLRQGLMIKQREVELGLSTTPLST